MKNYVNTVFESIKLGKLCIDLLNGFPSRPVPAEQGIAQIRPHNIDLDGNLVFEGLKHVPRSSKNLAKYLLKRNDVIFNNTNSLEQVGKTAYIDQDCEAVFSNHMTRIRVDNKHLHPVYLSFVLNWLFKHKEFQRLCTPWVNQAAVNNNQLRKVLIPVPPLEIQQQIVERLDAIRKAQELNDKQIALAEELFQSLLHRELDPKGKNWEVMRLGDVCKEIYRYPTYYNIKYVTSGIPEVRGELITEDGLIDLDKTNWRFIDAETSARFPRTQLEFGDVVLTVRGTIGKIGFIPKELHGANMTANLMRISPSQNVLLPKYFWFFLRSNFFQKPLLGILSSTTVKTLKAPNLKSMKVPILPLEIQRRIVQKLQAVQDYKKSLLAQKEKLKELFESTLDKAMKGELVT